MSGRGQRCVNFRDVGEWLAESGWRGLPTGRLLRSGRLEEVDDAAVIGRPGTIVNLRRGADPSRLHFGAAAIHHPIANDLEVYRTSEAGVRRWLRGVVHDFAASIDRYPVLVHCTSGKDRTGVVVATLLAILGAPDEAIVGEYLLSEGRIEEAWIRGALAGVGDPERAFRGVDLEGLRRRLCGAPR